MHALTKAATARMTIAVNKRTAIMALGVVGFTVAMIAAAHVRVPLPFSPVPVTMQTGIVLLAGAVLGPAAGATSMVLYLVLGAAGLPVFTTGATLGLTAGYLVGFALTAALVGAVASRTRRDLPVAASMVAGSLLIYLCGAGWLASVTGMSASAALAVGVLPFLPGDALKVVAAFAAWRTGRSVWDRATGN